MSDIKSVFGKENIYVYIDKKTDILYISKEQRNDTNDIPIIPKAEVWTKNELAGAIKTFHVRRVEYESEMVPIKSIYVSRPEPYERAVKGYHRMYVKKIIFLLKKTGNMKYLQLLTRQKFIILAKPEKENSVNLMFFALPKTKLVPVFSDSSEMENFINVAKENGLNEISEYSPLCFKYRELYYFINKNFKDFGAILDPYADTVKDVTFSLNMPKDFLEFMYHNRYKGK